MKKQYLSRLSGFLRGALIVGLLPLLYASCASNAPVSNGAGNSMPGQNKSAAQPSGASNPEAIKTRLAGLFGLCKTGGIETASTYFVYRGPDKNREWKDTYRASDSAERAAVEDGCLRIKGYLDNSQGYQFGAVKVEKESEGEWHVLEVSFQQGDKTKKVLFAFLPIKGQFAVGDIDG